jgi:hypothetical protein
MASGLVEMCGRHNAGYRGRDDHEQNGLKAEAPGQLQRSLGLRRPTAAATIQRA